jgi:hypothetical protein
MHDKIVENEIEETHTADLEHKLHKFVDLGNGKTLPIIVSNEFIKSQEISKVNDEQETQKAEISEESNAVSNKTELQENVNNIQDSAQLQNTC